MNSAVGIGIQDFEKLRSRKCFYVDKTPFIKEWWENADDVTLITRPRRFGKTINMSMLECFFSNQYEGRGEELFGDLSIWQEKKYRDMQGKYPVLFLSFASIKSTTYEGARDGIIAAISDLYKRHTYLLKGDTLSQTEKNGFDILDRYLKDTSSDKVIYEISITNAIHELSSYLYRYYGERVLIFLDEYDTPMQEAYVHGYWDKFVELTRSIFNSTFKTNPYMSRAVMTGITRVSRESIFSDFNNPLVVTTTTKCYETSFGFTEDEVFETLDEFSLSDKKEEVKEWYDGFTFGRHKDIYNPWSILNFLNVREFATYWANTSANSLVGKLIREGNSDVKQTMEELLEGKELAVKIDEQIVFNQLDGDVNAIWSLLLASGYLKIMRAPKDCTDVDQFYRLALTNKEVQVMFQNMIKSWFSKQSLQCNNFIKALMEDNVGAMNYFLNEISRSMFSYFDVSNSGASSVNPENFYHGFILGLVVDLDGKYHIRSNRESGFGRYDVMLEPVNKSDVAFVFEFKAMKPYNPEKTIEETMKAALRQIREKNYDEELITRGVPKHKIRHYGFAFEGKTVLIGGDRLM